jgi:preprotein translocase subunit YajC
VESAGSLLILLLLALPILLIVFQRRTMKRQLQQVQSELRLGAEVMTHSGVYGTVRALREDYIELEVAPGVVMRWARAAIGRVITPSSETDDAPERLEPMALGSTEDGLLAPSSDPTDGRVQPRPVNDPKNPNQPSI